MKYLNTAYEIGRFIFVVCFCEQIIDETASVDAIKDPALLRRRRRDTVNEASAVKTMSESDGTTQRIAVLVSPSTLPVALVCGTAMVDEDLKVDVLFKSSSQIFYSLSTFSSLPAKYMHDVQFVLFGLLCCMYPFSPFHSIWLLSMCF